MKCFNGSVLGIPLSVDEKLGLTLRLGEAGRGRKLTLVKVDGRKPPQVVEGRYGEKQITEAGLVEFEAGGLKRHAFVAPRTGDDRALVRAAASGAYTRGRYGKVDAMLGEPTLVEQGNGADGDAGRIGFWADTLWILKEGEALFIDPNNGKQRARVLHYRNGTVEEWSPEDWRSEVLRPLAANWSPERREAEAARADERRHPKTAECIRGSVETAREL